MPDTSLFDAMAPAAAAPAAPAAPATAAPSTSLFDAMAPQAPAPAPAASSSAAASAPSGSLFDAMAPSQDHAQQDPGAVFDRAIVGQESGGQQFDKSGKPLTSSKGAIGAGQIMPATGPEAAQLAGLPWDDIKFRTDRDYNLALGRAYYAKQYADFGDHAQAAAAYNAGPGALRAAQQRAAAAGTPGDWLRFLPAETQAYVPSVLHRAGVGQDQTSQSSNDLILPQEQPARTWGDTAADAGKAAISGILGVGQMATNLGYALTGADALKKTADALGGLSNYAEQSMTPRMQEAARKSWVDTDEPTSADQANPLDWIKAMHAGSAWSDPLSYAYQVAIQGGSAAVSGVLGKIAGWALKALTGLAPLAPALQTAIAAGQTAEKAALATGVDAVAAKTAGKAAADQTFGEAAAKLGAPGATMDDTVKAIYRAEFAGQLAEGTYMHGSDAANHAMEEIAQMPHDKLMASPVYAQDYQQRVKDGQSDQDAQAAAKEDIRRAAGKEAATFTGSVALPAQLVMAHVNTRLFNGGLGATSRLGNVGRAAAAEVPANAFELGSVAMGSNVGVKDQADPSLSLSHDVANTAVSAGVGALGMAGAHAVHAPQAAAPAVDPALKPAADQVAANPDGSPLSKAAIAGNTHPLAQRQQDAQAAQDAQDQAASQQAAANQPEDPKAAAERQAKEKSDALTQRAGELEDALRTPGTMDKFRGSDSQFKNSKIVADMAIAKSPSSTPAAREQAISRLEYALEWAGVDAKAPAAPAAAPAPAAPAPAAPEPQNLPQQQFTPQEHHALDLLGEVERGKPVHSAALRSAADQMGVQWDRSDTDAQLATRIKAHILKGAEGRAPIQAAPAKEQPTAYDTAASKQQRNEQASGVDEKNAQALAKVPSRPSADEVIAVARIAPALRTADQVALMRQADARYTPHEMELMHTAAHYAAGMSAEERIELQKLQGKHAGIPPEAAPQASTVASDSGEKPAAPAAREQVAAPVVSQKPASVSDKDHSVPSVHRKRRATLRQLVEMGMNKVERRGSDFVLTDGRREFKLEGAADAQLARREIQDHFDAATGVARGHLASNAEVAADNYKKGDHVAVEPGVTFIAEHGRGTERFDRKHNPPQWRQVLKHAYGDLAGTVGADGDKVDAFLVGDGNRYFVIDQVDPTTGKFDEHKVMLRARDEASARAAYLANYEPGWKGLGAITEMTPEQLRAWLQDKAATKRPVGKIDGAARSDQASRPGGSDGRPGDQSGRGVDDRGVRGGLDDAWARDRVAQLFGGRSVPDGIVVAHDGKVFVKADGQEIELVDRPDVGADATESAARSANTRPVAGGVAQLIEAVADRLGQKVVWYRSSDFGDGFTLSRILPDILFLNSQMTSHLDPVAVFGHEFWHNLKALSPELHAAVSSVVQARIKDGKAQDFRRYYRKDLGGSGDTLNERELEEMVSDLGGNFMSEGSFWSEVMTKIQDDYPEQSRSLVAKLAAFLGRMFDSTLAALRGSGFKTGKWVDDVDTIRKAFRDAMAQFMAQQGVRQQAMQAQILRERQQQAAGGFRRARKEEATDVTPREVTQSTEREGDVAEAEPEAEGDHEARAVIAQYRDTTEWMKAPNGKPTNLTERQWVHVRTPAFKAWFGDWEHYARKHGENGVWHDDKKAVSKVVDENGEPKVVFHGSDDGGFASFERPQGSARGDLGIFAAQSWNTAASYVTRNGRPKNLEAADIGARNAQVQEMPVALPNGNRWVLREEGGKKQTYFRTEDEAYAALDRATSKTPGVYALFMNLRDPHEASFEGANWDGFLPDKYNVLLPTQEEPYENEKGERNFDEATARQIAEENDGDIFPAAGPGMTTDDVVREARRDKNDGAIIHDAIDDGSGSAGNYDTTTVYVAFEPSQVKSADFNGGAYNAQSDDIRLSPEREEAKPAPRISAADARELSKIRREIKVLEQLEACLA